jgi:diaminopimelate epimerase
VSPELRFSKYQAAGNDFIVLDDLDDRHPLSAEDVGELCDRWFGVGADGVIRVTRAPDAPFAMELTNADGTPAQMSGNGARCLGAFLHDRKLVSEPELDVATPAGIRHISLVLDDGHAVAATVSMGAPSFAKAQIPMKGPAWETFLGQPFDLGGGLTATASAVSMGNPHLVLFLHEDPERFHVEHMGPALEHHELFPERTNVEFARIDPGGGIDVRVWERGVGETLACGTGACAVAVAANEAGLGPPSVTVRFRGGALDVERQPDGEVVLGGPVGHVFDGVMDLEAS